LHVRRRFHYRPLALACLAVVAMLTGCAPSGTVIDDSPDFAPPPSPEPVPEGWFRYTVLPGDTLYAIGKRFGVDWREIVEANAPLLEGGPSALLPGTVLLLPAARRGRVGPPGSIEPEPGARSLGHAGHDGPLPAETRFVWPLRGRLLAGYGQPVPWQAAEPNRGIDIAPTSDRTVVAAKSGRVSVFQSVPGYGLAVVLEHADGSSTFYGHLERTLVPHGRWVRQGEPLAIVGEDPFSNGVELHFRVIRGESFVNPLQVLPR